MAGISATASKALDFGRISPIIAWIVGGVCAMLTLFPWISKVEPNSPTNIKSENDRTVTRKFWILFVSLVLFVAGLGLAAWQLSNLIHAIVNKLP